MYFQIDSLLNNWILCTNPKAADLDRAQSAIDEWDFNESRPLMKFKGFRWHKAKVIKILKNLGIFK
ncbi:hypothetical protein LEP1GSC058_1169 [Leptospira fainei serovar Hurstbridge str. BUT 6]|uniref:Uncharacterized protein n=1 Tax=Leptospira fainei serovar Hurstbridge str. BUT 6 TaxID=1193011 RepID=S3V7X3_9LEPT|nr:hypothetical protein LEP1GSC058_1169 [Leptospira fainei serovar Hurstbridge str. BUT 6]